MAIDVTNPIHRPRPMLDQDETLETIFRASASRLRGRFILLTRDPNLADDLVSEAFLRLATEIRAGRLPDDPIAWLYRVGANLAVSRARRATVATRAMPGLVRRDVAPSPEDEVVGRERDRVLREVLASLSADDRRIVVLAAQGYRSEEIGELTGRSSQATRTRLCRARGRLRTRLELAGLSA
jgi:RNA polymerase sigma-70 factor (ECF subfamily)